MKVADYIAMFLAAQGVAHVFEVTGGMIVHLLDSLHAQGRIRVWSVHHEQAAAFAADAVGRMTSTPGVAMATSGPGATNLLTGIGSCFFDSSPAVFITGQVNRTEQKGARAIRQLGFQETDIVSIARPLTKAALQVPSPEAVPEMLAAAFLTAKTGRPGPVLLDIPMDVQRADIPEPLVQKQIDSGELPPLAHDLDPVLSALKSAERPLILAGGGIRAANATGLLRDVVDRLGIPLVNSLLGVDLLQSGHPLRVGMIGTYGNRWANLAISRSDTILVIGSRLDIRQTGSDVAAFKGGRQIFHVDVEPGEMNNRVTGCHSICADVRTFLSEVASATLPPASGHHAAWLAEISALRKMWPDVRELAGCSGINPNQFMHQLSHASRSAAAYVVDVGQHQMWAAQSLNIGSSQRFLTSGGMGAMGFALPGGIGASAVADGKPIVVISGDGGFQLNIQELETVSHHNLPLKMVVLNNRCHGMVRQFQESYFGKRYGSTCWGYSAPDFSRVAASYNIQSLTIAAPDDVADALAWLWNDPKQPALLQVMIDTALNAYPKIAFGRPPSEMEPFSQPLEIEST